MNLGGFGEGKSLEHLKIPRGRVGRDEDYLGRGGAPEGSAVSHLSGGAALAPDLSPKG